MSENKTTIAEAKQHILEQIKQAPHEFVKGLAEAYSILVGAETQEGQIKWLTGDAEPTSKLEDSPQTFWDKCNQ